MNGYLLLNPADLIGPGESEEAGFGALSTALGNLPLTRLEVDGRITGLAYAIHLSQTFRNVHARPLEATYIFPLPAHSGVTRFTLQVGDRTVEGQLQERSQARQTYQAAIRKGHRAALAEQDRSEVFTITVGNIPAGESVAVNLELVGPLSICDGQATFRFPLVVAPRYIPGVPLEGGSVGSGTAPDTDQVPDASRITPPVLLPGQRSPVRLGLRLEVDPAGLTVGPLACSLDCMRVGTNADGLRVLELDPATARINQDFLLRFPIAHDDIVNAASGYLAPGEGQGTLAITLVPPAGARLEKPQDVVIVLDRSGSMEGWKMVAARRAAARLVDSLTIHDRFTVLLFDDRLEELPAAQAGLLEATDRNRFRAVEFLSGVESRGGTEIGPALRRALQLLPRSDDREAVVVFITDGQVGNEDQLLRQLTTHAQGVRIHSVGLDRCVNVGLLQGLARQGGGHFELIESESQLDLGLQGMIRRLRGPLVTDLVVAAYGDQSPIPVDLFPGVPAVFYARCQGRLPATVRVRGRRSDGGAYEVEVPVQATTDASIQTLWARSRLLDLDARFAAGDRSLAQEITQLSLRFGVLCRFTAFVAVDKAEVVNAGGQQHQVTQPVESPAGWEAPKVAMAAAAEMCLEMDADCFAADAFAAPAPPMDKPMMSRGWGSAVRSRQAPRPASPPPPAPAKAKKRAEAGTDFETALRQLHDNLLLEDPHEQSLQAVLAALESRSDLKAVRQRLDEVLAQPAREHRRLLLEFIEWVSKELGWSQEWWKA